MLNPNRFLPIIYSFRNTRNFSYYCKIIRGYLIIIWVSMYRIFSAFALVISIFIFIACDGGLEPAPVASKSYIKGRIHYKGDWPKPDSIFDLRAVAFKNFPPANLLTEIMSGQAYFLQDSLPYYVDSTDFILEIPDPPVTLKYIAIAQRYGDLLSWRAVGV